MKQEHLQIIEQSILNDQDRLNEVDSKQEIADIENMLYIFNHYETELVNLNLELLKPYLAEKPDVFVTLEFIQCLLLGNLNNQLNFELDEDQRGLLVWICRMLETKKQELSIQPKLKDEEKYQIEQRLNSNKDAYEILTKEDNTYLSASQINNLAKTVSLEPEKLYEFYQDLIKRNNYIYLQNNLQEEVEEEVIIPEHIYSEEPDEIVKEEESKEELNEIENEDNIEQTLNAIMEENIPVENTENSNDEEMSLENAENPNDEEDIPLENIETPNDEEIPVENIENTDYEEEIPTITREINLGKPEVNDNIFTSNTYLNNLKEETKNIVIENDLEEKVQEIIDTLEKNNLLERMAYLLDDLILYSSKQIINTILTLAQEENIAIKMLFQIPSIFLNNTSLYQEKYIAGSFTNFINNVKILKENGIEINKVAKNSLAVLVMPYQKLETNLKIAKLYKIPFTNRANHEEYNFLLANDLASTLDQYIEMGLEIYVKEKTSRLINPDKTMFYRLYFANQKHLQYICQFEKDNSYIWLDKEITSKTGYGITKDNYLEKTSTIITPNNELYDEVIQNNYNDEIYEEVLNHKWIKLLEQYRFNNQNYYLINSIKISRLKVLRLFSTILKSNIKTLKEAFLYIVLTNTVINEKQSNTLRSAIEEICEEKVV